MGLGCGLLGMDLGSGFGFGFGDIGSRFSDMYLSIGSVFGYGY